MGIFKACVVSLMMLSVKTSQFKPNIVILDEWKLVNIYYVDIWCITQKTMAHLGA